MRITSHDVARRAGVSRTTVSMVLNKSTAVTISEATRRRVEKVAEELGYRPNSAARMLASGNTRTVGLVLSHPDILPVDGFIPQFLEGIAGVIRREGYHFLLEGLRTTKEGGSYAALVVARRIDGLIVLNPRDDDAELAALVGDGFPIVLAGSIGHPGECSISVAADRAMHEAVDRLCALGHRTFGTVTFSPSGFVGTDARLEALRGALVGHGLALDDDAVEPGYFSAASGAGAAALLLARRPDLSVIFAGNDTIAIGVISAVRDLGLRVPEDISVVGFDDLPFAAYLSPPLTTIRNDGIAQGVHAAETLIRLLKGEAVETRRSVVEAELVLRRSLAEARSA